MMLVSYFILLHETIDLFISQPYFLKLQFFLLLFCNTTTHHSCLSLSDVKELVIQDFTAFLSFETGINF